MYTTEILLYTKGGDRDVFHGHKYRVKIFHHFDSQSPIFFAIVLDHTCNSVLNKFFDKKEHQVLHAIYQKAIFRCIYIFPLLYVSCM